MPPMNQITIVIGGDYLDQLEERMLKHDISRAELAREMGVDPSQISRMFNKRMTPRMANIQRIEAAILAIRRRRRGRGRG